MVTKGVLQPEKMPPTDRAAYFHGLRAHLQIVTWKLLNATEVVLDPKEWGWSYKNETAMCPIMTDREVAPASVLKIIHCNCKQSLNQCGTNKCTCRRNGLNCVSTCGECHGSDCENNEVLLFVSMSILKAVCVFCILSNLFYDTFWFR